MRQNRLLNMLRGGEVVLGVCNMYPASGIIEGMCGGWDFVWIDGQHGEHSYHSILSTVQASMGVGVETLIRVPDDGYGVLGRYADLAPSAIMVPMVSSAGDAQRVVDGLRFPPRGKRSFGGRRVIDVHGIEYYQERDLVVVAQIETVEAVEHAEEIITTDGIDCLFFGPDDTRVRLGIPIDTPVMQHTVLREAMEHTAEVARGAGKFSGSVVADSSAVATACRMGYQLIVGGADVGFLREGSASRLKELRQAATSGK